MDGPVIENMCNFKIENFNINNLFKTFVLKVSFNDIEYSDLRFSKLLNSFENQLKFIRDNKDIKHIFLYFDLSNAKLVIQTKKIKEFIDLILNYSDMFENKLICTQLFADNSLMTFISKTILLFYKTVKPLKILDNNEIDEKFILDNINNLSNDK